jgi:signal transduction histidine kinase
MKDEGPVRGSLAVPFLAGAAVLAVTLFGLVNLTGRPGIRDALLARPIVGVDGFDVRSPTDIRFALSRKRIGDPVEIRFGPDAGGPAVVRDTVIPYYSQRSFPLALMLMGGVSFLAGFVVLSFRPRDRRARLFFWLSLSFGATVIIGGGTYGLQGRALNLLPGVLFNLAYPMTVALLVRFALSYGPPRRRPRPALFWGVPAVLGFLLCTSFLVAEIGPAIEAYRLREVFKHVLRFYVVVMGVAALVEFARSLRHTESESDRAQIKGYLIGLALGLGPFLALNQLPLAVADRPILSEDFTLAFFLLVPIFMVISILQLRLLRVNVVFHRGLVYSILTVFTLGVFLLAVEGLRRVFPRATATGNVVIMLGAAVFIAVLLSPGRRAIQDFVDQLFFRQSYDYRKAVLAFRAAAPGIVDAGALVTLYIETLTKALPVSPAGLLVPDPPTRVGLDGARAAALDGLAAGGSGPWTRAGRVHAPEGFDLTREDTLAAAGAEIVLALPRAAGAPAGFLVYGPKLSGHRFTKEDVGLIETLAEELAVNLGRIRIQEEMIYERASREKTEELVRMKTEFISAVAHELRTPVTSLDGLSGLLRSGKVVDPEKRRRLLALLAGECRRLSRFLTNVLDYGRIEGEAKTYRLEPTDLRPIVRAVSDLVRESQADGETLIRAEVPEAPVVVAADADAVRQALLNLVDNALKYSPDRREVTVSLAAGPEGAVLSVRDRGIGVPPEDRERIFEAFFRSPGAAASVSAGVGLGLKIVRHIMDAHRGRVEVESEPGAGSVFRLIFPRQDGVKP